MQQGQITAKISESRWTIKERSWHMAQELRKGLLRNLESIYRFFFTSIFQSQIFGRFM